MNMRRLFTVAAIAACLVGGVGPNVQAAGIAQGASSKSQSAVNLVIYNDFYKAQENNRLIVPAPGVLANDDFYWQVKGVAVEVVAYPQFGKLAFNGDGSFEYLPVDGYVGVDTFVYQARAGKTATRATVVIDVMATAPAVIANDDAYKVPAGALFEMSAPGVLGNDVSTDPLTVAVVIYPKTGKLQLDASGAFIYMPPTNYTGVDTFVYSISDGKRTSLAQVTLYIVNSTIIRVIKPRK